MSCDARAVLALLTLALAACGEPLVGARYLGTPALVVRGPVEQQSARVPADHGPLSLGVLWIGSSTTGPGGIEQDARLGAALGEYSMQLFDAPPEGALHFTALASPPIGLGVIALYADRDDSGALELADDLLLGASPGHVVAFTPSAIEGGTRGAALLGAIGAGYHVFALDTESTCRFIDAAACTPEGRLTEVEAQTTVPLVLWDAPEDVVVPAPKLGDTDTIWGR